MSIFRKDKNITDVPLRCISPNPDQPRKYIDQKGIKALASSIEENGLINPITLKKQDKNTYYIICGERRYRAFCFLGRETIPAIIKDEENISLSAMALVENTQRSDLSFLEEAMAIKEMMEENSLSQIRCAELLGISQSAVANKLRILKLPREVLLLFSQNGMTERHARALLTVENKEKLLKIAKKAVDESMSVRQLEKLCLRETNRKTNPPVIIVKDIRVFTSSIDSAVSFMKKAGYNISSSHEENENDITYTIVIPKINVSQNKFKSASSPI